MVPHTVFLVQKVVCMLSVDFFRKTVGVFVSMSMESFQLFYSVMRLATAATDSNEAMESDRITATCHPSFGCCVHTTLITVDKAATW